MYINNIFLVLPQFLHVKHINLENRKSQPVFKKFVTQSSFSHLLSQVVGLTFWEKVVTFIYFVCVQNNHSQIDTFATIAI